MTLFERTVNSIDNVHQIQPLVIAVVFPCLSTIAIVMRLVSKRIIKASFSVDDYMILAALFFIYGLMTCNILGVVSGGVGIHLVDIPDPGEIVLFSKTLVAVQLCWAFALMFVKFSLLFFYIQIFSIRSFRVSAYVVMGVVSCWALSVVLETFLLCRPFKYNWDPTLNHTCGNRIASYIASGGLNLVTDIMVLSLPVPMVWALRIPRRNKIILFGVFGVGLFVCVISILRLVALLGLTYSDITFSVPTSLLWSVLEPCIGCICACVPLMRPLFTSAFPDRMSKGRKSYGYIPERKDNSNLTGNSNSNRSDDQQSMYPLASRTNVPSANEVDIRGGRGSDEGKGNVIVGDKDIESGMSAEESQMDGINVRKEFRIQHY